MHKFLYRVCLVISSVFIWMNLSFSQEQKLPQMQFLGAFDAGQQGVSIFKMYDASDNVICYLLMPEVVGRRNANESGTKFIYDGNTIGSISCVKTRVHISVGMQDEITNMQSQAKQKNQKIK